MGKKDNYKIVQFFKYFSNINLRKKMEKKDYD